MTDHHRDWQLHRAESVLCADDRGEWATTPAQRAQNVLNAALPQFWDADKARQQPGATVFVDAIGVPYEKTSTGRLRGMCDGKVVGEDGIAFPLTLVWCP